MSTAPNRLANIQPRISKNVTARALTIDIERLPGRVSVYHGGFTTTGNIWDLNALKHVIGRRIHADDVIEWPRTICAAARWYGDEEVMFAAEWEVGGYDAFMRQVWSWVDEADILIGHNMAAFDSKHLMSGWAEMGLPAPSPYKVIDTLKIARGSLAMESNTLDSLAKRLGVEAKTDKYDARTAKAAVNGDKAAQEKLAEYNRGDIIASEALFDRLRPYAKGLPHMGMWVDDEHACPSCGETMKLTGKTVHANVQAYEGMVCPSCGAHGRSTTKLKNPTRTRAA
ncbi:ribonuclease H-like domain-containing protein [Brachybacterium alimentarium]|uniref:ribonuclease H-like domain-containing protein n=1 Tax=Brachybacterium alimentarium TaxID=47845 RepID=UPI003FD17740